MLGVNIARNDEGVTIFEAVVLLLISTFLVYALTKNVLSDKKVEKSMQVANDYFEYVNALRSYLEDPDYCKEKFQGKQLKTSNEFFGDSGLPQDLTEFSDLQFNLFVSETPITVAEGIEFNPGVKIERLRVHLEGQTSNQYYMANLNLRAGAAESQSEKIYYGNLGALNVNIPIIFRTTSPGSNIIEDCDANPIPENPTPEFTSGSDLQKFHSDVPDSCSGLESGEGDMYMAVQSACNRYCGEGCTPDLPGCDGKTEPGLGNYSGGLVVGCETERPEGEWECQCLP